MTQHELLCFQCMTRLNAPGQICPVCGHDNTHRSNGMGYLPAGVLENQYFVGKVLGHGGFGVTYVGFDLNLARKVAIKEYYPRELVTRSGDNTTLQSYPGSEVQFSRGCERALDEGRMIANIRNVPNIVQVYSAFPSNGTVYTVMEYVPGVTLTRLVEKQGALYWKDAYALLRPIMQALALIHERNVIHRDVSPDNIMFDEETRQSILLDFGAAHMYMGIEGHSYTLRPCYAPIEQYSGLTRQDGRTDEYAMCATLYFLLTAQKPPESTQIAYGDIPLPSVRAYSPDIPEAFEAVLFKGMAIHMTDRYASMNELIAAFDEAAAAQAKPKKKVRIPAKSVSEPSAPAAVKTTVSKSAPKSKSAKKPVGAIIAGSLITLLAVVLAILIWSGTLRIGDSFSTPRSTAAPMTVDPTAKPIPQVPSTT